ncbi:MAG: hypothetical protein ACO3HJ_07840, partial [Methylophilaceae bacterium]
MFKLFEIKEGKFTAIPDVSSKKIRGFIFGSIIILAVISLSGWLKIDEKDIWKFYNQIVQHFGLDRDSIRIESEKERDARIESDVDRAIEQVIPEYDRIIREADQIYQPKYLEEENDETLCYTDEC